MPVSSPVAKARQSRAAACAASRSSRDNTRALIAHIKLALYVAWPITIMRKLLAIARIETRLIKLMEVTLKSQKVSYPENARVKCRIGRRHSAASLARKAEPTPRPHLAGSNLMSMRPLLPAENGPTKKVGARERRPSALKCLTMLPRYYRPHN